MSDETDPRSSDELLDEFLTLRDGGAAPEFEQWVRRYSDREDGLREAYAEWTEGQEALEAASGKLSIGRIGPGTVVGDFRLIRLLGRGGQGTVWEASQASIGNRPVALKILSGASSEAAEARFAREGRAAGRLNHPGLVPVYDTGRAGDLSWIAMELVGEGQSLRGLMDETARQTRVPAMHDADVARMMAEIAEAMEFAHEAGVIHRDLKPQNILLTREGGPKVADFGLARVLDETALSSQGDIHGTYPYMSPEQVAARRIDRRTDIFSLGVVMYEMLTLRRPFQGDTGVQISHQILSVDPPDPRTIRSRVPRDLAVICGRSLEKEPAKRYQSMADLAEDLRRHLQDRPIIARPPTFADRYVKWTRRHPGLSVAAVVSTIAIGAILFLLLENLRANDALEGTVRVLDATNLQLETAVDEREATNRLLVQERDEKAAALEVAEQERDRAVVAREEAARRGYAATFQAALVASASSEYAEMRTLLSLCGEELRGWEWRQLQIEADPAIFTRWPILKPQKVFWTQDKYLSNVLSELGRSPDAINREARRDIVRDLRNDPFRPKDLDWSSRAIVWSPTGRRYADVPAEGGSSAVRIIDVSDAWGDSTGTEVAVLEAHVMPVLSAAWSPSGHLLATGSMDDTMRLWDTEAWLPMATLSGHKGNVNAIAWSPEGDRVASASDDKTVKIWSSTQADLRLTLEAGGRLDNVAWSPSGRLIAASSESHDMIYVWELGEGTAGAPQNFRCNSPRCIEWNPEDRVLLSGHGDGTVQFWYPDESHLSRILRTGTEEILSVAWSPYGGRFVSAAGDGSVRAWDRYSGPHFNVINAAAKVGALRWSPDGHRFACLLEGHRVQIWDAGTWLSVVDGKEADWSAGLAYDVSERYVSTALANRRVDRSLTESLDLTTLARNRLDALISGGGRSSAGSTDGVPRIGELVAWSPSGDQVLFPAPGSQDLMVVHAKERRDQDMLAGIGVEIVTAAWTSDSDVTGLLADGQILQWDTQTGASVRCRVGGVPVCADWSVLGDLVVVREGGIMEYWARGAFSPSWTQSVAGQQISQVRLDPGGEYLATAGGDGVLRVWAASRGELTHEMPGHRTGVRALAWSPDADRLVSAGKDNTVRIWDPVLGIALRTLQHSATSLDWSPSGHRILAATAGQQVLLLESREEDVHEFWRRWEARNE